MAIKPSWPCALTVAGSDSGGGAGIQADLKTFFALGVHGTSAMTSLTAQNPRGVRAIHAVPARFLADQMEAVFDELPPRAIKTGMLFSDILIDALVRCLDSGPKVPLVVDPVMVSTSGARLLKPRAVRRLREKLMPRATLVTPNLDEAILLTGLRVASEEDLRMVARNLHGQYGCAVLVKGGHLRGVREAADLFYDGQDELLLTAPFVRGVSTHGTGCTYAAAVTAFLAHGQPLTGAVAAAKHYITSAIQRSIRIGCHQALNWSAGRCPD